TTNNVSTSVAATSRTFVVQHSDGGLITSHIASVVFTGSSSAPTVTVNGSGFGPNPPTAYPANNTSCGIYTNNGYWYGKDLSFLDVTNNWQAGAGNASGGNCIGLIVQSWTPTQIVFTFGSAYGSFDHWTADLGDSYTIHVKTASYSGVVSQ